jgi:hypothetical protein
LARRAGGRRAGTAWAACLLALACASAPPAGDLDAPRRQAMIDADVAALREIFADGLRFGHANGEVHPKEELLGLLGSGRIDYRAIGIEEIETRELAGAVVVTGRQTIEVRAGGRDVTSRSVFTAVYAREGSAWRLVAYQSTPVATPAAPSRPAAAPAP